MKSLFKYIFQDPFRSLNPEQSFDRKALVVIITCSLSLIGIYYGSRLNHVFNFLTLLGFEDPAQLWENMSDWFSNDRIFHLAQLSAITVFFEVAVPVFAIVFILRDRLTDYGLGFSGAFSASRVYLMLLAIVMPIVVAASFTDAFQNKYPIYYPEGESLWPNFVLWEVIYIFRFFGVEFLFRGFLLHGLKRRFGYYSVFVTVIPYCMVHFGKPLLETIASTFAGIALGALSLRTNSIWPGVFLHCCVGLGMDLLALWHRGYFAG